jgi:hypothetical protein
MSRIRIALLVSALCASGCGGTYYATYKGAHPDWFPVFPSNDIGLEETVASLYAPPTGGYQLVIQKLTIVQTDVAPWKEISAAELESGAVASSDAHDYAVAALVWCQSEVDLQRYVGTRASWYLLPKDRMTFYDHHDFTERCAVADAYLPATGDAIEVERKLIREVTSTMTREPTNRIELYEKGIALAKVGRIDEAKAMLAAGDATSDPTEQEAAPRFDPGRAVSTTKESDSQRARRTLVEALKGSAPPSTHASAPTH